MVAFCALWMQDAFSREQWVKHNEARRPKATNISFPLLFHTTHLTLTTGTFCERLSALRVCLPLPCTGDGLEGSGLPSASMKPPPCPSLLIITPSFMLKASTNHAFPTPPPLTAQPTQASLGHRGATWLAGVGCPSVPGLEALATRPPASHIIITLPPPCLLRRRV